METFFVFVQAFCALATLVLAIEVYFQNNKINTLTDVVTSLNKQNEISQKILSFEIRSRMMQIQPVFKTGKLIKGNIGALDFSLINTGTRARNIEFAKGDNIDYVRKSNIDNRYVVNSDHQEGAFKVIDFMEQYTFQIIFEDDFGAKFQQVITGNQGRLRISIPEQL